MTLACLLGMAASVLAVFATTPQASSTQTQEERLVQQGLAPSIPRPSAYGTTATDGEGAPGRPGAQTPGTDDVPVTEPTDEPVPAPPEGPEDPEDPESSAEAPAPGTSAGTTSTGGGTGASTSASSSSSSGNRGTGSSAPPPAAPPASGVVTDRQPLAPTGTWLSGASGDGVANGEFAAWRGSEVAIAGTWSDNNEAMLGLWALRPGADLDNWAGSVDNAIGGIGDGETWEQAARGAYDDRWRESLTSMRELWAHHSGTLYIRFAHEMNSNWYPWSVDSGSAGAFVQAWRHFRALQQEIFPEGQLVFCVNKETVGTDVDWRTLFPGSDYVDVMGVDYYNAWPHVSDQTSWDASMDEVDGYGAPKGLQAHLDFARSVGLPLAIPEWSGKAFFGDSPAFMENMHAFFERNAGGGAGQLLYEILFNIDMHDNDYRIFGVTNMPNSAEAYRRLF